MNLHPWWTEFGQGVGAADDLTSAMARAFAAALARGTIPGIRLMELRRDGEYDAVRFEIDGERPQELAYPIKAIEPVAILFPLADAQPRVLALREDFPDTPHQNWTPEGAPCSLCIDDRPWPESKLTLTPADLVKRVQLWLAKAARGELHDPSQPLDPLFFRSGLSIVIPPSVFANPDTGLPELIGFVRKDNPGVILTMRAPAPDKASPREARFIALAYRAAPQGMRRLRHAPTSLAGLHAEMERCGVDLIKDLKACLATWAGLKEDNLRRLNSRLVIIVVFPVQEGADRSINDLRAFITGDTAGEVGVALGALLKHETKVGAKEAYAVAIGAAAQPGRIGIEPAEVHFGLDRNLAAAVAGRAEADRHRAVLVGAGALGSQVAMDLAREGALSWTIVDQDCLSRTTLGAMPCLPATSGRPKRLRSRGRWARCSMKHFRQYAAM
jgi:hypothetical protein